MAGAESGAYKGALDDIQKLVGDATEKVTSGEAKMVIHGDEEIGDEDAATFKKIAAYLNPNSMGPTFVSKPIRGKIYIMRMPRFIEALGAQSLATKYMTDESGSAMINRLVEATAAMAAVCEGWISSKDEPSLQKILANLDDRTKWPTLQKALWFDSRDPNIGAEVGSLWQQYENWRNEEEPTEDALERYYSMVASAGF